MYSGTGAGRQGFPAKLGTIDTKNCVALSRPFGLYAGNVFQGIVKVDGNPIP
jgi:cobalt/nickel transport protein